MAFNSAYLAVGTTATALNTTDSDGTLENSILIKNPSGSVTIYIGGSAATADTAATGGYPLLPGAELAVTVRGEVVYGIVATTTTSVNVLRQGV